MTTNVSAEYRIAIQRKTVQDHVDGECEHDYEKVSATFVQDDRAYYQIVPGGIQYDGIQGVVEFYATLNSAVPDLQWCVTREYDVPGCSIREGIVSGTHSADFAGVPASGNFVEFEVCALYIFDEQEPDKLIAERAYWDNDSLIRQLMGEKTPKLGLRESGCR